MPDTNGKLIAPWSDAQVETLNLYQRSGVLHPFTCADRGDEAHRAYAEGNGDPDIGLLVAHNDGWHCPVCTYRQTWAHGFMADRAAIEAQQKFMDGLRASAAAGAGPET